MRTPGNKVIALDELGVHFPGASGSSDHVRGFKESVALARKTGTSVVGVNVEGVSIPKGFEALLMWKQYMLPHWNVKWRAPQPDHPDPKKRAGTVCAGFMKHSNPRARWRKPPDMPQEQAEILYRQHSQPPHKPCVQMKRRMDFNYYLTIFDRGRIREAKFRMTTRCAHRFFPYADTEDMPDNAFRRFTAKAREARERDALSRDIREARTEGGCKQVDDIVQYIRDKHEKGNARSEAETPGAPSAAPYMIDEKKVYDLLKKGMARVD